jgi:hypothetical protein
MPHFHFAMIVQGVFVDPVEWWDPHWIQDNIDLKADKHFATIAAHLPLKRPVAGPGEHKNLLFGGPEFRMLWAGKNRYVF